MLFMERCHVREKSIIMHRIKNKIWLISAIFLEILTLYLFLEEKGILSLPKWMLRIDPWHMGMLFYIFLFGGAVCLGLGLEKKSKD